MQQPAQLYRVFTKKRWLSYGECLADRLTIRESADRCNLVVSTAFYWRHRFLGTQEQPPKLKGIVEADVTNVLESRKGDRNLDRKVRRRGGNVSKRGLSDERVPILVAVDRSGTTACPALPSVTADSVQCALEPRIDDDNLLVTDGNNVYPSCTKSLGIKHEALNQSTGEGVRGAIHIRTVNNRYSGKKGFLHHCRGVSSIYLGKFLRWYDRRALLKSSPRSCLATAIGGECIQFEN